ncbi:hypothetical protein VNI00_015205 [Paramarasmius palmivorus]|uniref:Uncharacterized protein n=1 Tax=Paramarasmius palmivorus TaxID=297713 RepID=A0AAW0BLQ2_9AGAR
MNDEEDSRAKIREALNDIHWHHSRVETLLTQAATHLEASRAAAAGIEQAFAQAPVPDDDEDEDEDEETDQLISNLVLSPRSTGRSAVHTSPSVRDHSPPRATATSSSSRSQTHTTPASTSTRNHSQRAPPASSFPPKLSSTIPKTSSQPGESRSPQKKSKNRPAGGYVVLFGKGGVSGYFEDWAVGAGPVYIGAKGAIVQGYRTFEDAKAAWRTIVESGLIAYVTEPAYRSKWFIIWRGALPGVCQRDSLVVRVGVEHLEHISVDDLGVADTQEQAERLYSRHSKGVRLNL